MASVYETALHDLRSELGGDPLVMAEFIANVLIAFMEENLLLDGSQSAAAADKFSRLLGKLDRTNAKLDRVSARLADLKAGQHAELDSQLGAIKRKLATLDRRVKKLNTEQAEAHQALAEFMTWSQANFEQMATASAQNQELGLLLELAERNGGRHAR